MSAVLPTFVRARSVPAVSFCQLGCEDAKCGRAPRRPSPNVNFFGNHVDRAANQGYMNGYAFGLTRRYEPAHNEGSEP